MRYVKFQVIIAVFLLAASRSWAADAFDLQHIYSLTEALEYDHWAEEVIPGSPSQGVLLFKVIALTVTFPLFAVLLIWSIISGLQSEGRVDYADLVRRILIFTIFVSFGTVIYGYMSALQRGMHSLIEIVSSQESEFFLRAFYKEDASNQNILTRAINEGKEDAIAKLLNTSKEIFKYQDNEKGAMRSITRAHYMALPLAAY